MNRTVKGTFYNGIPHGYGTFIYLFLFLTNSTLVVQEDHDHGSVFIGEVKDDVCVKGTLYT